MKENVKIAIVDDDKLFSYKLCDNIKKLWDKKSVAADIYNSGKELEKSIIQGKEYSIYFLDIEMPEINGMELANYITQSGSSGYIIFITSYEKYALQSIKLGAFYYIMKEELDEELKKVLEKINREACRKCRTKDFLIGTNSNYKKVRFDDICYITREGKNAIFYCEDAQYVERKPLKTVFQELPEGEFAYINSGQIVNLRRISRLDREEVKLDSGVILHCSRRMRKGFEAQMLTFWENL